MMNSAEAKAFCLSLKCEDITKNLIDTRFSYTYDTKTHKRIPPEIDFQTEFYLEKGEYKDREGKPLNPERTRTNVGQYIVNLCLYGRSARLQRVVGYVAKPFDKDVVLDNEALLSNASMEKKIEPEDWAKYFNSIQWLGFTCNTNVAPSFSPNTVKELPEVRKLRKELYNKYRDDIANGNTVEAVKIEKTLTNKAKEILKNDVGMVIYDSKCKPSFGNNYKNCFVTRGPMWNPAQEKFNIVEGCFSEGIHKEDIAAMGTSVITGSYTKCCMTSVAGYITKKLFTVYQGVKLDKHGTDCHTKKYRTVTITKKNASKLKNRYIIEGKSLIELTEKNMEKYMGKTVKMRSPLYCLGGETICNKCAGEGFYNLGIQNVGLTTSSIGSNLLNRYMKAFHDATTKLVSINVDDMES